MIFRSFKSLSKFSDNKVYIQTFTLHPIYITVSTRHVVRRFSSFLKNSPQKMSV